MNMKSLPAYRAPIKHTKNFPNTAIATTGQNVFNLVLIVNAINEALHAVIH